jgi:hypothetical protein
MEKLCTNITTYEVNKQSDIDNSECFGVTFVKIYPEMIWF